MEFNFKNAVANFVSNFGSWTETTSARSIETNPVSKSVSEMNSKPTYKDIDGFTYLKFGKQDDVDLMLDKIMYKSATHSGIVTKKAKMITGNGLSVNSQLRGTKNARLSALIKHAGGANVSLYDVMTRAAFEYIKSGAYGVIIDLGNTSKDKNAVPDSIVKFTLATQRTLRFEKPASGGNFTHMIYKRSGFQNASSDSEKAERIPLYNPFSKETRQIFYVKNPYSTLDSYGLPNYIGAFSFIEADYEFGRTIENAAKNGFSPKTHVTMVGRNMSKSERQTQSENIQERLSGSTGDQVVVSFVGRMEEKPFIDKIESNNLDKTIEAMSNLNDAKILTAHNITSPSLFGIMTAGRLGGTGTELISAYKLFRETETIPDRKVIIDSFTILFEQTELKDVQLEILENDVEVDYKTKPVAGGNLDKAQKTSTNGIKE